MKPALMIIDLQKAYHNGPSKESMDNAAEYINAVLPWFREQNLPILWVQDADAESGVVPGTEGFEFIDSLTPLENEHRITKTYTNSFNKTDCAKILTENGVDTVIITGYCAEYCVLTSYRGAQDHDFTPFMLRGGIASGNPDHLRMVLDITDSLTYGVLKKIMAQ